MEFARQETQLPHTNGFIDELGRNFGEVDSYPGYVSLGDICRQLLGQQCQYGSRYIDGAFRHPNLGSGLRYRGSSADYYAVGIHPEDVQEFVQRVVAYRAGYHGLVLELVDDMFEERPARPEEISQGISFLQSRDIVIDREPYKPAA